MVLSFFIFAETLICCGYCNEEASFADYLLEAYHYFSMTNEYFVNKSPGRDSYAIISRI